MGVDWYSCKSCEDIFPDCGDYVSCESCGTRWCSYDCAHEDGYVERHCKLGIEIDSSSEKEDHPDCPNIEYCSDCDNYVEDSCGYCNGDIVETEDLLEYALILLDISRTELLEKYKIKE